VTQQTAQGGDVTASALRSAQTAAAQGVRIAQQFADVWVDALLTLLPSTVPRQTVRCSRAAGGGVTADKRNNGRMAAVHALSVEKTCDAGAGYTVCVRRRHVFRALGREDAAVGTSRRA
jgi:hypothetical protein